MQNADPVSDWTKHLGPLHDGPTFHPEQFFSKISKIVSNCLGSFPDPVSDSLLAARQYLGPLHNGPTFHLEQFFDNLIFLTF